MTKTKLATAAAVSLALAGASGVATAEITGIPAEAQLGPMVLSEPAAAGTLDTYIALTVPLLIGLDTVTQLAAPHVLAGGATSQQDFDPRIHWTLFDENSKKIQNGTCFVSPGDTVLWTTDVAVQALQQQQTTALGQEPGFFPSSRCGPTTPFRVGYVIFQTYAGADAVDADFAFWANGAIVDTGAYLTTIPSIGTVPMLGMADGADPTPAGSGAPTILNSVIVRDTLPGDGNVSDPVKYAPILSGVRMNDSDASQDQVFLEAPIQGPQFGSAMSLHVSWFDRNDPLRVAAGEIWDDQEGACSWDLPMPRELNLWMWNSRTPAPIPAGTAPNWANFAGITKQDPTFGLTDVISVVKPSVAQPYSSLTYCQPPYWGPNPFAVPVYNGALGGYYSFALEEINDPVPTPGLVNSAAAFFHWQEAVLRGPAAWSTHMTTDLGKI